MAERHCMSDAEAVAALIETGRAMAECGFAPGHDGNISVRVGDAVWITPAGVPKGQMTGEMPVKTDLFGRVLEGTLRPSSEISLHLHLYRANPEIGAVVHAHPPMATAFAAAGMPLRAAVIEAAMELGPEVPVLPFAPPGSEAVGEGAARVCRTARAALLEFHGAVSWGADVKRAFARMTCLEQLAKITLCQRILGSQRSLSDEQVMSMLIP